MILGAHISIANKKVSILYIAIGDYITIGNSIDKILIKDFSYDKSSLFVLDDKNRLYPITDYVERKSPYTLSMCEIKRQLDIILSIQSLSRVQMRTWEDINIRIRRASLEELIEAFGKTDRSLDSYKFQLLLKYGEFFNEHLSTTN